MELHTHTITRFLHKISSVDIPAQFAMPPAPLEFALLALAYRLTHVILRCAFAMWRFVNGVWVLKHMGAGALGQFIYVGAHSQCESLCDGMG
jgi:hypothetical protein